MKSISEIYKDTPIKIDTRKTMNPRSALIERFRDNINAERDGKTFKKVDGKYVAIRASHLNMDTLEYLFAICMAAKMRKKSFSKVFFGLTKTWTKDNQPK